MTTTTGLAPKRADELEHLLGPLADPAHPTGARAVLAADERAETLTAGESLLHSYGLNAEFVPPELGGRLERADHLAEVMRALYRRDPALGLGYGAGSLIAGVTVWTAGDERQREHAARLLLNGRRVAVAFHELAHGNDMAGTEFTATTAGDGSLRLSGRKEVVTNIRRAEAMVVLARTDPRPGPRSHSLVLVDRAGADRARLTDLPRFASVGMRGVQLGGLVFDDLPVPATAVLGPAGSGLETALKALQITRTVLPTMATGILDTGLRIAVDHLTGRRLYGGAATDIPHVRSELAGVFADLLRAEALGAVGARALHLVPRAASVYASAVKFEVSRLLLAAMDRLANLLGAHFYLREGPTALFQKLLRDLAPVGFGHIARAACQMSLLPQLPLLARRTWAGPGSEPPDGLFALAEALPPLRYDLLALHAAGRDPVAGSLHALADTSWEAGHADLRTAVGDDRTDLADLAAVCEGLSPVELGVDARPETYDLVTRYVRLLTRTVCVQVWRHAPSGDFLADPAWLRAVLHRSASGPYGPGPLPAPVEGALLAELLDRRDTGRSFGLTGRPLAL
ncbi:MULTISPECIES: acyl-CoA dehydrogenase [Streptomyces]|uniref:acyl-CoA dehydrogenase n=1 Tax=Streptomyces scabiei TaxID=1930 RepID=UPI0004E63B5E|nr:MULTISPECIES: acyl-CoA dehydrogenase [Streptomyces]MBP5859305.1 acyl-CoA dehydrogenase [Streptomyces sp. LBUM 1484]KFG08668.1 oxidoreductase [Streptomyces scabiei]MBP5880559.1 acyl-CoA dehydrogenase [Streptomyces sp. LBUM 1477]MBP5888395.1 acyl-CoA dehydrogenase [Streptomyces sp. LBUM 1487]MBP5904417.1 acyl-CoA dehydrogenase [Streptomyces sp. LBUM 1488]